MTNNDRLNHIIAVARLMVKYAYIVNLDNKEMFALGLLPVVGYDFD